jgi:PAS domain S-box-containing protein
MNIASLSAQFRTWWRKQTPHRQDRFALLGPIVSVLLFLIVILASFAYLRLEEIDREQESIKRDVEYAQQNLRLRLLDRQEEFQRLARDIASNDINNDSFIAQAEDLISKHPELHAVSWIDNKQKVIATYTVASAINTQIRREGDKLNQRESASGYALVKDSSGPVYAHTITTDNAGVLPILQVFVPIQDHGRFAGLILGEYSIEGLLRFGVPSEINTKYAVTLINGKNSVLAGSAITPRYSITAALKLSRTPYEYQLPVSPVGNDLLLRAQGYRTSLGLVGSALFWLAAALSVLTVWMLFATWRHTRKRQFAQQALIRETNFRRAMENSMLTGMRALDLTGKITYVNPAFCQITGWSEEELVGCTAPFPYWPKNDHALLNEQLRIQLSGQSPASGFQFKVSRKDGGQFDARMYVSPLIDDKGVQTGWMTSTTDITEPNRIRHQLLESQDRFITVLESMDASVSVAPLGRTDLLFANKLYRSWFGADTVGHMRLIAEAGIPLREQVEESGDDVDSLAGLPYSQINTDSSNQFELFCADLNKWLEIRSRYITWVDGRLAQMVIATDITQRRNAEMQEALQVERAQSASRLITMGEMASSVAHELNQPLTAINIYCNGIVTRIKDQQISENEIISTLEKTSKQAQRAAQIIQRIRTFVKRSAPNRNLSNIYLMVESARELADIEMRRRNVHLHFYVAARLPKLFVDPILIEQVLINLLKNAAESVDNARRTPSNRRVELRVAPMTEESRVGVEFSVIDTGSGIPPDVMARLYESFFSTKAEGMGMGLSLCRSIVESHAGRIKAENIYNGELITGCRFSFWLPLPTESELKTEQMNPA